MIDYQNLKIDLANETISDGNITLTAEQANNIAFAYERMTTANFLIDTYGKSEEDAWNIADQVRERMADYPGLTEEDAIDEIMDELEDEDDE